jgi:hypothetical protein
MKEKSASDLNLLNNLNAVRLKEEELSRVLTATKKSLEEGKGNEMTGVMTTIRLFDKSPDKAKAIIFRLQALASMIEKDELQDWVMGIGSDVTVPALAQKALIRAATDHPLSMIDGDISFEKDSFLRRVLELAEPQGRSSN